MGITCILGSAAVGGATGAFTSGMDTAMAIGPRCQQGYQWGLELGEESATRVEGIPITAAKEISLKAAGGAFGGAAIGAMVGVMTISGSI